MEYIGYYGSIEYSQEDDCLFGKVLGMPDNLISYEGNTVTELYIDFKEAIETYLDYCQRNGFKPRKVKNLILKSSLSSRCIFFLSSLIPFLNKGIREELKCIHYATKGAFVNKVFQNCNSYFFQNTVKP